MIHHTVRCFTVNKERNAFSLFTLLRYFFVQVIKMLGSE